MEGPTGHQRFIRAQVAQDEGGVHGRGVGGRNVGKPFDTDGGELLTSMSTFNRYFFGGTAGTSFEPIGEFVVKDPGRVVIGVLAVDRIQVDGRQFGGYR